MKDYIKKILITYFLIVGGIMGLSMIGISVNTILMVLSPNNYIFPVEEALIKSLLFAIIVAIPSSLIFVLLSYNPRFKKIFKELS